MAMLADPKLCFDSGIRAVTVVDAVNRPRHVNWKLFPPWRGKEEDAKREIAAQVFLSVLQLHDATKTLQFDFADGFGRLMKTPEDRARWKPGEPHVLKMRIRQDCGLAEKIQIDVEDNTDVADLVLKDSTINPPGKGDNKLWKLCKDDYKCTFTDIFGRTLKLCRRLMWR